MNTVGASTIMMLGVVLVVVIVSAMMITVARGYASSDFSFKVATANNFQMMVDTLVGVPGDAIVKYPYNASNYTFILRQDSINVLKKDESEVNNVIRGFFLPSGYTASGVAKNEQSVCLEKSGKSIFLRGCKEHEP